MDLEVVFRSMVSGVDLVSQHECLLCRLLRIGAQWEKGIWEGRGNVELAGPDLISWIVGYRAPAAKARTSQTMDGENEL